MTKKTTLMLLLMFVIMFSITLTFGISVEAVPSGT